MKNSHNSQIMDEHLKEECGVFGMYDFDGNDVATSIYYGLLVILWDRKERSPPIRIWGF